MFSEESRAGLVGNPDIMYSKMLFIFGGGGQRGSEAAMGRERPAPHFRVFEPKITIY